VKKILFNTPLQKKKYFDNVKKLLDSKKSLHGPGKNIFQIKKDLKKLFGFNHVHLTNSCTAAMEMCALMVDLKRAKRFLCHHTIIIPQLPVLQELVVK
jgi:dTDP-4-amino-4,6-dideoxygalactose transaminase